MASDALHGLFNDMYRYSGPEGVSNQPQPASQPSYPYQPSYSGGQDHDQYGRQQSGCDAYKGGNIGAGMSPAPPTQAPPTYRDIQTHRDQVVYPYQPTQQTQPTPPAQPTPPTQPNYPYQQPSSAPYQPPPASYPYQHPQSVSSSTSELSDISSGVGTADGRPQMLNTVNLPKMYTSGSSVDSSSGIGSYNCETPEQLENTYKPQPIRQDSFPPPPPPMHMMPEASVTDHHISDHHQQDSSVYPSTPVIAPSTPTATPVMSMGGLSSPSAGQGMAPPLAPPPPPPAPPLPPSNSVKQTDTGSQQPQQPPHPSTRLEQQLSNMGLDDYGRPTNSFTQSPTSPYSPTYPAPPEASPAPASGNYYGGSPAKTTTTPTTQPKANVMPDAVMNMAARGEPDKKPWTYGDMESIKEQREKVRRRAPGGGLPRYQQMLNMPRFDDNPGYAPVAPQTPQTPVSPGYGVGPGEADVAHLQYNSPLNVYSENNVAEAFTGQTDGVVTGVAGLKKDGDKDMTQSPVYRMIHGLDAPQQRPIPVNAQPHVASEVHREPKTPADDEMSFSGVLDRSKIPSKSFNRLQNMTVASEIDTTSIRANVSGDDASGVDEVGAYDQASIRYTGKNIPSKSFRMLQSMTGGDTGASLAPPQTRRIRRPQPAPQPQSPEQNPDDIVDIAYVGGNIPSRTFRVLQKSVGESPQCDTTSDHTYGSHNPQGINHHGRTVKVIKLRQQHPEPAREPSGVTDF